MGKHLSWGCPENNLAGQRRFDRRMAYGLLYSGNVARTLESCEFGHFLLRESPSSSLGPQIAEHCFLFLCHRPFVSLALLKSRQTFFHYRKLVLLCTWGKVAIAAHRSGVGDVGSGDASIQRCASFGCAKKETSMMSYFSLSYIYISFFFSIYFLPHIAQSRNAHTDARSLISQSSGSRRLHDSCTLRGASAFG